MIHEMKILPEYYNAVLSGDKTFEIRLNDRDYQVGDILILKEFNGESYTGREIAKEVSYILQDVLFGLRKDYCVMGLKSNLKSIIESKEFNKQWLTTELNKFIAEGDGVLKFFDSGIAMDSQKLYRYFDIYGLRKLMVLELLDKYGFLKKDTKTRTKTISLNGKSVRSIVIKEI